MSSPSIENHVHAIGISDEEFQTFLLLVSPLIYSKYAQLLERQTKGKLGHKEQQQLDRLSEDIKLLFALPYTKKTQAVASILKRLSKGIEDIERSPWCRDSLKPAPCTCRPCGDWEARKQQMGSMFKKAFDAEHELEDMAKGRAET